MNNTITLKAIGEEDFLNNHFFIPSYQRGYRWTDREVSDLLNDIQEFHNKRNKEEGEFYCLQPIVVINRDGNWEVIDGQQRLTTLFIILTYLGEAKKILFPSSKLYSIEYETREKDGFSSKAFLDQLKNTTEIDKTNSDFYHMSQAYLTVKTWFEKPGVNVGDFLNTLLKTNFQDDVDIANNIRFIWYEVTEEVQKPIEIFTRLNMGKIALTNAELVKALFFITDKDENTKKRHQLQMGYEWDQIENALQNKNFWYFLTSSPYKGSNHIELIFNLIADKYVNLTTVDSKYKDDKLYTFYVFNDLIVNKLVPIITSATVETAKTFLWDEIKTYYRQFLDFYNHNEYYHLIGYLIHSSKNTIADILSLAENETKTEFEESLKNLIRSQFKLELKELSYDNYDETHRALLLFNVISTMKSNYNRFPFEKFEEENWSLEHIHAQNSEGLKKEQKRLLLIEQQVYFAKKDTTLFDRITQLLGKTIVNDAEFNDLQNELFSKYSDKSIEHSIQNMALLTRNDNSSLNNNIFPIKKDKIKELDEKGSFIPIGTKNVFMKYYSSNVDQNVSWNTEDQDAYYIELEKTLKNYLPNNTNGNEN
ncbi:DUF262 domain-containing protein [Flavobacterium sp. GT3P67]|uniref:DUF262 domain-containing protein n=1 Tax=Flavobacterium sp. GT3P67 TaxID=2541722 RepID=UPI001053CD97|nr:DUF262 domain-containing protein [Flavobacterium sp. GT3P67]TDE51436.1 DUF262 domain-containing protein [Flavobacterium sp. GT3P67]